MNPGVLNFMLRHEYPYPRPPAPSTEPPPRFPSGLLHCVSTDIRAPPTLHLITNITLRDTLLIPRTATISASKWPSPPQAWVGDSGISRSGRRYVPVGEQLEIL